uniref:Peptidase S1 domain-containing protein n=1 Tax=Anopheles dirus TaxID=7168 RepID=A0A182NJW6_9DIPT
MDYELRNIKDFLQLYNKITDMCFNSCVDNLFGRDLTREEISCADNCVLKFTNVNQRLLGVYVGVQGDINQRRMAEVEAQQAKMMAEAQQQQQQQEAAIQSAPEMAAAPSTTPSESTHRESGRGFSCQYDAPLCRLQVHERDSWKGITPSTFSADYNPSPPILAAKFAKCRSKQHILAIANEDGKIALQDTNLTNREPGGERALEGMQCHYNAVFDIEWMPGEMKLVTASGDHTAKLWSLTESEMVSTQTFRGHSRSVKTVAFRRDDAAVFATGGRDGAILIWDIRAQLGLDMVPRADNCIYSGHVGGPGTPSSHRKRSRNTPKIPAQGCSSSITGLVFHDGNTLISCGAGDGMVKVWDTRRHYTSHQRDPMPKYSFSYAGSSTLMGFTNLAVDESRNRLYVNCMDSHIYCYNIASYDGRPVQRYGGFNNGTFYVKAALSADGQYLISGSSDERCYIWNVDNPDPLVKLAGHSAEVTSVAWMQSDRDVRIVTCSDDARHKVWRIGPEEIDSDERQQLRGTAEYCESYRSDRREKQRLKALEFTPRSVRGLVQRNETTPSTLQDHLTRTPKTSGAAFKINVAFVPGAVANGGGGTPASERAASKRTFSEVAQADGHGPPVKRSFREEGRGRRLFSPANSKTTISFTALEIASSSASSRSLNVILEASDELVLSPCKSPLATANLNVRSPDHSLAHRCASPTLNLALPNYVLDGEAPHLVNVLAASGGSERTDGSVGGLNGDAGGTGVGGGGGGVKRKLKEHIDWLTKIRKQKQLQAAKGIENSYGSASLELSAASSQLLSPRLQQLKSCDEGGRGGGGGTGETTHHHLHPHPHLQDPCQVSTVAAATSSSPQTPTTPRRRSSWAWHASSSPQQECADEAGLRGVAASKTTPRRRRYSINGMRGLLPATSEPFSSVFSPALSVLSTMKFVLAVLFLGCVLHATEVIAFKCTSTGNTNVTANGRPTYAGQFPHHVLLVVHFGEDETRHCSGALVDERHVVTVAQCVQGSDSVEVHLGTNCLLAAEDDPYRYVYTAVEYTVRDGYDAETFVNDVAVVRFTEEPVRLPPWVRPVRLPELEEDAHVGQEVRSSGFGLLNYGTDGAADALQFVRLVVLELAACQEEFTFVTPNTGRFCAQEPEHGRNCVSDVGSPLVLKESRRPEYVLLGLASFGQKFACNHGNPGALQEMREHAAWVKEVLAKAN